MGVLSLPLYDDSQDSSYSTSNFRLSGPSSSSSSFKGEVGSEISVCEELELKRQLFSKSEDVDVDEDIDEDEAEDKASVSRLLGMDRKVDMFKEKKKKKKKWRKRCRKG